MNATRFCYVLLTALSYATIRGAFFEQFHDLKDTIPYVQLANLPTPVQRCEQLETALNYPHIYVKRDDLTGHTDSYGGNKVRKLEFLLADALQKKAKRIITFGCVGTNHGLATACYARKLGLDCLLMLKPQPNSPVVRQNLLLDHHFNAKIQLFENNQTRNAALKQELEDKDTYFFPTGGSVPLGALGYVNAVFELKKQIEQGLLAEPDFIYLPIGSCGTTAGLLLGLQMTNLKTKIVAVGVEPEESPDEFLHNTQKLFAETNQLLHAYTPDEIPMYAFPQEQLIINKDFVGTAYGAWLESTEYAADLIHYTERIVTEGTYSAKAIAALVEDIQLQERNKGDILLFWDTYCGCDFSHITKTVNCKELPEGVHHYFQ